MEVIDNRDFLISKIKDRTDSEIKRLEKEHDSKVKEAKDKVNEKKTEELADLKAAHKKAVERIKKQEESSFDLFKEKGTVKAESEVFARVITAVEDILSKKGKARDNFYENLAKRIEEISDKKIKSFRVPKGVSLKGKTSKDDLEGVSIIGIIDDREEVEITLQSLLDEKSVSVGKMIREELF